MRKRLSWYAGLTALLAAVTLGAQAQPLTGGLLGRPTADYSYIPAPPGCAAGFTPYFNSSLKLVCSPTVYAPTTDTTTSTGTIVARNLTASGLATPGAITVTPTLTRTGTIVVVGGSDLVDGDYFTIDYGPGVIPIEFDELPGDGTTGGRIPYVFDPGVDADAIRDGLIALINLAAPTAVTAASGGAATITVTRIPAGTAGDPITENVTNAGFTVAGFAAPTAATSYTYSLLSCATDGSCTEGGPASKTTAGHATLSAANSNALSWSAVSGAALYKVRRDAGGATTGVIWSGTALAVSDTGLAGDASTKPLRDGTGVLTGDWYSGQRLPDGSIMLGEGTWTPLCSFFGASVGTVTANYSDINATANGCPLLQQGDVVAVTSAAIASNRGLWQYIGNLSTNVIGVLGVMSTPDTAVNFTVYRNAAGISADGRYVSSYRMTRPWRPAMMLGYYVDQTTGGGAGLEIFFNGRPGVVGWGDGETSHHPLRIYRGEYKSEAIFDVDAQGNVMTLGNVNALSGNVSVGRLTVTGLTAPATAPGVTAPYSAPGSTTWTYRWVPVLADGSPVGRSAEGTLTTGPAVLDSTDRLYVSATCTAGTAFVDWYRTVAGGTPATTGKIGRSPCPAIGGLTATWDTGLVGDGTTAPTTNLTGEIAVARNVIAGNDIYTTGGFVGTTKNVNGQASVRVFNNNAGASAMTCVLSGWDASIHSSWCRFSAAYPASGVVAPNRDVFRATAANGLAIGTGAAAPMLFFTNGVEVARWLSGGGLQYATGTRPTCDATTRGTTFYVAGGAGVADTMEVCGKSALDAYAWVPMATF